MYEICLKVTEKTFKEIIDLTPISMGSIFDFGQVSAVWVIEYLLIFS